MTIYQVLQSTGLPCAYSHFLDKNVREADNTFYWRENRYQVEYYFKEKNEQNEATIEQALLDAGYLYEKSEDTYIESEGVFVIYYSI